MILPFKIAKRYLFSKNNHAVINIISKISAVAIGFGALALVVIMSVFNGFNSLVTQMYSSSAPDFTVEASVGKTLCTSDERIEKLLEYISEIPGVNGKISAVVEENAYFHFNGTQCIGSICGSSERTDGAVVGEYLATLLKIDGKNIRHDSLTIFMPTRLGNISLIMPSEGVNIESVQIDSIQHFEKFDMGNVALVPLATAQQLLEYEPDEANRLELYLGLGAQKTDKRIEKSIKELLGDDFVVKNFYEQNQTMFNMMKVEKLAVYIILFFAILIIAINILSTIAIMIIDKEEDIKSYKAMGTTNAILKKTFTLQGTLICLIGAIAGIVLGVILCLLQKCFGLVKLPGNFMVDSYPVTIKIGDILVILFGIMAISFFMSYIPARVTRLFRK